MMSSQMIKKCFQEWAGTMIWEAVCKAKVEIWSEVEKRIGKAKREMNERVDQIYLLF